MEVLPDPVPPAMPRRMALESGLLEIKRIGQQLGSCELGAGSIFVADDVNGNLAALFVDHLPAGTTGCGAVAGDHRQGLEGMFTSGKGGKKMRGFSGSASLDRSHYGVGKLVTMPSGVMPIGKTVSIQLDIEFHEK